MNQTKGRVYERGWPTDGRWMAYSATKRGVTNMGRETEAAQDGEIALQGGGGSGREGQRQRRATGPRWSPDSRAILLLAGDRGKTTLFRVGLDARRVDRLSIFYFDGQFGAKLDDQDSKSRPATESTLSGPPYFQIGNFSVAGKALPV